MFGAASSLQRRLLHSKSGREGISTLLPATLLRREAGVLLPAVLSGVPQGRLRNLHRFPTQSLHYPGISPPDFQLQNSTPGCLYHIPVLTSYCVSLSFSVVWVIALCHCILCRVGPDPLFLCCGRDKCVLCLEVTECVGFHYNP